MTHLRVEAAHWPDLERLLDAVLDVPPEARDAWLDSLGPEHDGLRSALRAMLANATAVQANDFLAALPRVELRTSPASQAGALVGPWRLMREIGAGGMASVWLAERADGMLQRSVALKLPHNIARWRGLGERMAREREILAALTHPNIARLYDAGIAGDNTPWLAIEYVEGVPIDQYCRSANGGAGLALRERLKLFLQVGDAVAYAHGKLIVHRDLKPANILVTEAGQVRLLDFGIAALLEGNVAHESPLTEITGRALTLDYAAPEQIAGSEYTTSADVYSLGVILFELVTGRRPYLRGNQSRQAFEKNMLDTDAPRASDVAADDRRQLRGDLDTILQKALKKNPGERYRTAAALVEDVARHLDGRPVLAQPDRASYRAWKFIGRHKLGVASAAAIVVAVLAGSVLTAWQARVALAERDRAEEVKDFIASIFQSSNPYQRSGGDFSAAELLRRAATQIDSEFAARPELRAELLEIVGSSLNGLGDHEGAERTLRKSIAAATQSLGAASVQTVRSRVSLADVFNRQRDTTRLEPELKALLPLARAIEKQDPEPLVRLLMYSADLGIEVRRVEEARVNAKQAFDLSRRAYGDQNRLTIQASNLYAETYTFHPYQESEVLAHTQRGLEFAQAAFPPGSSDPLLQYTYMLRARAFNINGMFHEAAAAHADALAALRAQFGSENLDVANALAELGGAERNAGDIANGVKHGRESLALYEKLGKAQSADCMSSLIGTGSSLLSARRPLEALELYTRARKISEEITGPLSWDTLGATFYSAWALAYAGRHADARELLDLEHQPGVEIAFPQWFARVKASILRLRGDNAAAIAEFERALSLIKEGPRADWERMRILSEIGLAEQARGNEAAAYIALTRARELYEKVRAEMHPMYAEALVALGQIEIKRGHEDLAAPLFARAAAYWKEFDPTHPEAREAAALVARVRPVHSAASR
jgi:serine/threonine protein kinase